jgi:hypothetical protein
VTRKLGVLAEMVEYEAGLDAGELLADVEFQDLVEVLGVVDDDGDVAG